MSTFPLVRPRSIDALVRSTRRETRRRRRELSRSVRTFLSAR